MFSQQPVQMREQCVSRLIMGSIPQVNPIRGRGYDLVLYLRNGEEIKQAVFGDG